MQLTKGAIGNLINRYKAVLKKCHLMNTFGSLAVAGMLVMGGAGVAAGATDRSINNGTLTVDNDSFNDLQSPNNGGAIWNNSTATITKATFNSNTATYNGGAIFNNANSTLIVNGVTTFDGNMAMNGGAIWNNSTATITDATFDSNKATSNGGAIQNSDMLTVTDGKFDNNWANKYGGAIYNNTNGTLTVTDGRFDDNTAKYGGAIFNVQDSTLVVKNTIFKNNKANAFDGGAIWNKGTATITNATFDGNKAGHDGGAIFNVQDSTLVVKNTIFKNNKANAFDGGAIWNKGTATITNATFDGNTAGHEGGAIYNDGVLFLTGTNTFTNNTAADKPNDIYNAGTITVEGGTTTLGSGLIMANTGTVKVLNSTMQIGALTANGGTMFVDPAYVKIDSVASSTFGTQLLVSSGSTVNIGGMPEADMRQAMEKAGMSVGPNFTVGANQSVLVLGQALTLGAGGKIVVDADVTDTGTIPGTSPVATAHFGKDSLLVVNGTNINGTIAALTLSAPSTEFTVQNGAKLLISGAQNGKTYTVIANGNGSNAFNGSGYSNSAADGWKGGNLMASSDMVTLTSADGMTFTAGVEDAKNVFPNLSEGMTNAVNKLYRDSLNNVDSDQMGVRFLSRATDNRFLGADKDAAAATIESAARIAFAGAVPQMTKMASDAGTNAVVNRLGFADPADGAQAMDAEGKIVDRNTTGFALWIAPLWQSQHGWGMDADSMDYGFNGNLGGVSLGADYTFENAIRAGITFNIGGGYAESSGGDLSSTENRMNFWGLGAYAGWNYENFGLMADVSYTSTWNDLKQDVDGRMGMGDLEADVQATAISAGLRAEYLLQTSVMDIIPHIGVRYMSLNTWGFDAESNGGTVLEGDGFHQDIWTFPIGVTFSKDIALDNGFTFKPSVAFSVIPAAGDIKAKQDVAFTGLPGTYEVETQMMDYLTWQGGVGLELGNDTMSFGVNYTLQAGQHTTSHGVFGSFRYEF